MPSETEQVSWNIPCVGQGTHVGLRCNGSMDTPCDFHALSLHCTNLCQKFAEWRHDTLALFPDSAGNTVGRLCLPVILQDARNRYGGHSQKVSGAQQLAQVAVLLPLIQLMARWSSDVVARFVAKVPLGLYGQSTVSVSEGASIDGRRSGRN